MSRSLWKSQFNKNKTPLCVVSANLNASRKKHIPLENNKIQGSKIEQYSLKRIYKVQKYNIQTSSTHVSNVKSRENPIEIKVWSRSSTIMLEDVGKRFKIYNGKIWIVRKVVQDMVSHKWGEFACTKKKTVHKLNKSKQKTKK